MQSLVLLISQVIDIYIAFLIAHLIMHWLVHFNILNRHQRLVATLGHFFHSITEPALRPIRRTLGQLVPAIQTIDISPIVLILLLNFARNLLFEFLA